MLPYSTRTKWYENTALVIVLLILLFPVGLYALWRNSQFSNQAKILTTLAVAAFVLIAITQDNPNNRTQPAASISSSPQLPRTQPTVASTPTPQTSYEVMLASLDRDYPVNENDSSVARYRYLLTSLERKTTNTRQQIADMTVNMQQSARRDYGRELKLIDILEASNRVIPQGRRMDYAEVSAMVMVTLAQ